MLTSLKNTFVVATLVTLSSSVAFAADPQFKKDAPQFKQMVPQQNMQKKMLIGGYYSPSLRCNFSVQTVNFYGYTVRAARLVSDPQWGSPLKNLGLRQGDVIFRLDGVPVANNYELENHYSWTTVRYSRQGVGQVRNGQVYIQNNQLVDNGFDNGFDHGQP